VTFIKKTLNMSMNTLKEIVAFAETPWQERYPETSTYEILCNSATRFPDNDAIKFLFSGTLEEQALCINYRELLAHVNRTANMLHAQGVDIGGTVSMVLPNLPQTHFTLWGAQALGVVGPINPLLEASGLRDIMRASETQTVITLGPFPDSDIWQKVLSVADEIPSLKSIIQVNPLGKLDNIDYPSATAGGLPIIDFDISCALQNADKLDFERIITHTDIASYFHTGGTTGTPKLAQHTHGNQVFMAGSLSSLTESEEHVVGLTGLPLFHCNAVFVTGLNLFRVGACALYVTPSGYRNPNVIKNFWQLIEKYQVTYFSAVPTLLSTLLNCDHHNADLSSLKYVGCGAAPLSPGLFRQFSETFDATILEGYGMTEGTCCSASNPLEGEQRIGSVGLPMPYQTLRTAIFNEDGDYLHDCATDEVGELLIKGPNVFVGYKQTTKNKDAFHDGFLRSGDLARIDADGYIWLTGRAKDLIIRGGHNIDPGVIENCLTNHPAVALVAAVGQPDAHSGELPCAFVTMTEGSQISADELIAFTRQQITERAATPVHIEIMDDLPVTAVGKIFKPELRRRAIERVLNSVFNEHNVSIDFTVMDYKDRGTVVRLQDSLNLKAALALIETYPLNIETSD
jgi:fatty-acyl-CoA synthase